MANEILLTRVTGRTDDDIKESVTMAKHLENPKKKMVKIKTPKKK